MIPKKEPAAGIRVGDKVSARVTEVLEDGKLCLSLREKAYIQMGKDEARPNTSAIYPSTSKRNAQFAFFPFIPLLFLIFLLGWKMKWRP